MNLSILDCLSKALCAQLRPGSLEIVAICSVFFVLAGKILFASFFQFLVLVYAFRNAAGFLRSASKNIEGEPDWLSAMSEDQGFLQSCLFILLLLMAGAIVHYTDGLTTVACLCALLVVAPAAIMHVALRDEFLQALNPANWLAIVTRLGLPYFIVGAILGIALLAFLWLAPNFRLLPAFIAQLLSAGVAFFLIFVSFHLLGQLIWAFEDAQSHLPVGTDETQSLAPLKPQRANMNPELAAIDDFNLLIEKSEHEQAVALMQKFLHVRGGSADLHQRYRSYLKQQQRHADLLAHGQQWLHVLLEQGAGDAALRLFAECALLDPKFRPNLEDDWISLARVMSKKAPQAALALLAEFAVQHVKSKHLVEAQLLRIDLLQLSDSAAAAAILAKLFQERPDDERVRAYVRASAP